MKDKDDRVGLRVVGREMKRIKCCRILFLWCFSFGNAL